MTRQIIDIPAIRAAVPMQTVLEAYGISVSRGVARCPFHNDTNRPNMKVYPDGYMCFACGNGGDQIKFVSRMESVSNTQAALKVAAIGGMTLPEADYRSTAKMRQMAQERRRAQRERESKARRYRQLCADKHSMERLAEVAEPLGDAWCYAMRTLTEIEHGGELDELFDWLGQAGI